MFSVLYTVRDNKGKRKDHVDQMEEDEHEKVPSITTLQHKDVPSITTLQQQRTV